MKKYLIFLTLSVFLLNGCATFTLLHEGEQVAKKQLPDFLQDKSPEYIAKMKKKAHTRQPPSSWNLYTNLAPGGHKWIYKDSSEQNITIRTKHTPGLYYGDIIFNYSSNIHLSGQSVASYHRNFDILLYLFNNDAEYQSGGQKSDKNNYVNSKIIAFGAIGWGRLNNRLFMQFLWIPIPVGTVK